MQQSEDHVNSRHNRDICTSLVDIDFPSSGSTARLTVRSPYHIMAATVDQSQSRRDSSQKKAGRRRNENNIIYANPLPILFSPIENKLAVTALGVFGISPTRVLNPRCQGTFDPISRSVWITDPKDRMVLWRRGFFGKGNLSRSEPSWLVRLANSRSAAGRRKSRLCPCGWPHVLRSVSFRNDL